MNASMSTDGSAMKIKAILGVLPKGKCPNNRRRQTMVLKNKTKLVLLAIAAIASLLMGSVFQAYADPGQQKVPTLVVFVNVTNDDI